MEYVEPVIEVVDSSRVHDVTKTSVRVVEGDLPSDPVAPASLWSEAQGDVKVLELHRLIDQGADGTLHFESYDLESPLPERSARLVLRSWWLPVAWEALTDGKTLWQCETFNGDEPEPCLFTWEEIRPGDRAFHSNQGEWASVDGYNRFIRDDVLRLRAQG